ncbi:MAG: helix-hairpin-helix domain-containing protein, partial [Leadbetterella sp.]|nr:helix-hairpin-helix domain-containing protein [Leadbetterella sp.]
GRQSYPRQEINLAGAASSVGYRSGMEELNYEEIYENLYSLYQNPLDLNRADREDLSVLFFLNERQISELLEHRQKFGRYLSLYELQALESFGPEEIRRLIPFITVSEHFGDLRPQSLFKRATDHYLVIRADMTLEKPRGFREEKYAGSRQRYYTRYRLSRSKDFSAGFISEKDPGEKNFLDYTAFHVQLQNKGNLKNIVAGDFLLQFGQGLVFSAGYAAGKGGEPVYSTRRSNLGAKPYNSLVENGSFRGIAATYRMGKLEVTGMVSRRRRDASVSGAPDGEDDAFSSLLTAGMHRTEGEIAGKGAVAEQNFGGNVLYKLDHLRLGFSVLNTRFEQYFRKRELLYNFYEFEGKVNTVLGPNLSVSWQNFSFFGEAARSSSGGYGYIAGLAGSLGKQVEVSLNHRNYRPDFHTLYGSAFQRQPDH